MPINGQSSRVGLVDDYFLVSNQKLEKSSYFVLVKNSEFFLTLRKKSSKYISLARFHAGWNWKKAKPDLGGPSTTIISFFSVFIEHRKKKKDKAHGGHTRDHRIIIAKLDIIFTRKNYIEGCPCITIFSKGDMRVNKIEKEEPRGGEKKQSGAGRIKWHTTMKWSNEVKPTFYFGDFHSAFHSRISCVLSSFSSPFIFFALELSEKILLHTWHYSISDMKTGNMKDLEILLLFFSYKRKWYSFFGNNVRWYYMEGQKKKKVLDSNPSSSPHLLEIPL